MNKANLATTNSTATLEQIYDHLLKCKDNYQPPLDTYTAIPEYAQKLKQNATTFETWSETQLIGLIACYFNTQKKEGYITNVSILKEYQGRRIASHLIEETLQHSYKTGIKTIKLHANNQKAIQFYEKHGFTVESNEYNRALMSKKLESQITVSICCVTYNHGEYIKQALDSFLAQKTRFNIEILIHDDASTDNTPQIIEKIEKKYPTIIKPIYQKENQFSKGIPISRTFNFPRARGKYIALCEGDDYWTDPYKLQKQIDFLEHNKAYSICFHNVKINKHGELINDYITRDVPESTSIIELAKGNYMHTPSVVFKRNWQELPSWFALCPAGDYPLHMINAQFGKIKKLDEVMAVYRIHNSNIWANQDNFRMSQNIHAYLHEMIDNFESGANEILKSRYLNITRNLIKKCLELNQRETANYYLTRLVEKHPDSVLKSFLSDLQPPSTKVLAKALLDQVNYKVRNYFFKKKNA